jgi:hypothetical protein
MSACLGVKVEQIVAKIKGDVSGVIFDGLLNRLFKRLKK